MDNNFLLTYTHTNTEGMYEKDYSWHETEEDLLEGIELKKEYLDDFEVEDAIEILSLRELDLSIE